MREPLTPIAQSILAPVVPPPALSIPLQLWDVASRIEYALLTKKKREYPDSVTDAELVDAHVEERVVSSYRLRVIDRVTI